MQKSLVLAQQFHDGQKRKGGADYLVHPLRVCTYLVSLNFDDDVLLSTALLHDVIEDNDIVKDDPNILVDVYKLDEEVLRVVQTCSYGKLYYPELSNALTAMKYHLTSICDSIEYMNK